MQNIPRLVEKKLVGLTLAFACNSLRQLPNMTEQLTCVYKEVLFYELGHSM